MHESVYVIGGLLLALALVYAVFMRNGANATQNKSNGTQNRSNGTTNDSNSNKPSEGKNEAYREGYKAFGEDVKHYRNPYDEDEQPDCHGKWRSGWRDHWYKSRSEELRERLRGHAESSLDKKVKVFSSKDDRVCGPCAERDEKIYTPEEALRQMPLPHENCQNFRCRCVYLTT